MLEFKDSQASKCIGCLRAEAMPSSFWASDMQLSSGDTATSETTTSQSAYGNCFWTWISLELAIWLRTTQFSCSCLPNVRTAGTHYHAWSPNHPISIVCDGHVTPFPLHYYFSIQLLLCLGRMKSVSWNVCELKFLIPNTSTSRAPALRGELRTEDTPLPSQDPQASKQK